MFWFAPIFIDMATATDHRHRKLHPSDLTCRSVFREHDADRVQAAMPADIGASFSLNVEIALGNRVVGSLRVDFASSIGNELLEDPDAGGRDSQRWASVSELRIDDNAVVRERIVESLIDAALRLCDEHGVSTIITDIDCDTAELLSEEGFQEVMADCVDQSHEGLPAARIFVRA